MAKRKSLYTVKESVAIAFCKMSDEFYANALIQEVKRLTARPYLRDDTILRRLRELREETPEKYGYRCIDHERSIYKKVKMKNANKTSARAENTQTRAAL